MESILSVNRLNKTFHTGYARGKAELHAVKEISFKIGAGSCFGLIGESGSGKTTVAKMIAGQTVPTSGEILFRGKPLTGDRRRAAKDRRGIQMIFQNPYSSFSPRMTLGQALSEALVYRQKKIGARARKAAAEAALEAVGLDRGYAGKRNRELSGGECQRAAIAQALLGEPELLICDEITSALDVSVQAQIIGILMELRRERNLSILFISHDIALVSCVCEEIAVMKKGEIVESGPAEAVISKPGHPYTKELTQFYRL